MIQTDIEQRLAEAVQRRYRKQKLESLLESTRATLKTKSQQATELKTQLDREERDVKNLEGLSLAGLFYTLLGSKDEQMDKERQEYLTAKLHYDAAAHAEVALAREIDALRAELDSLGDAEAAYQAALAEKESWIRQQGGEAARQLTQVTEDLAAAQSARREIQEALQAGEAAEAGLGRVLDNLQSAENWGTWDMLGGGFLTDMVKHSRLDDARSEVHQVQQILLRFQRELADVPGTVTSPMVEISEFDVFADTFFDSLLTDWLVQTKISKSLENTQALNSRVREILARLRTSLSQANAHISGLAAQKQRLLENV